eukprot:TRINITY_DN16750_c0_g1_i1.p1 TRINITY_DN16750_c0_g1~~TRINITY_DN16750_c0_g1_i1.p1  ORF type:complete len:162 (-),score=41.26 TRINITY_DN16750_c0_g1_i1:70-555(-)
MFTSQICFALVGLMVLDLAFDLHAIMTIFGFQEVNDAQYLTTKSYYDVVLHTPHVMIFVMTMIAGLLGCLIYRLIKKRNLSTLLVALGLSVATPYFLMIVKPAEEALYDLTVNEMDQIIENCNTIAIGHIVLLSLSVFIILLVNPLVEGNKCSSNDKKKTY